MEANNNNNDNDSKPMVVMVTGGSGLVGQAIRMYVETTGADSKEKWIFLSSKDGDIRDRTQTEAIFEKYKPTHVIHLAAKVGGLFANMSQKVRRCVVSVCVCIWRGFIAATVTRALRVSNR